jgi:hypothetical protein
VAANQGYNWAHQNLKMLKIHASETAWVGTEFDHVLINDHSIDELYDTVKSIVSNEITLTPSDSFFAQNASTV